MRIRLEASDRLPFWIIGDPALPEREVTDGIASSSQALNESIQITRNQQTVPGTEWEVKRFRDRGNQSVTIEATGHRLFTTYTEREEFIESLCPLDPADELHRWQGDVWIRVTEAGGVFRDSLLPDAVIALTGTRIEGAVSLHLTYRIQAGGFDASAVVEGTEGVLLMADGLIAGVMGGIDFFGTETGGAVSDPAPTSGTWVAAEESTGTWLMRISANANGSSYSFLMNWGTTASVTDADMGAPPISGDLAAIAALLNPAWITATVVTVSGRSALRLALVPADDGSGALRRLYYQVYRESGTESAALEVLPATAAEEDLILADADGVTLIADTD